MANPTVVISGRVGTDIESRTVGGSQKVKFRLITSDRRKNDKDEWEDKNTSGWNITAWDKLAERVLNHLEKGDPVTVQGVAYEDSWEDKEGNKRKTVEIKANNISLDLNGLSK